MSAVPRACTRWSNRLGVCLYRRSRGRLGGPGKGAVIALITVPGRRTGAPRTVAIGLHRYGAGFLAAGTGSGSAHEPDWLRNLRAASLADVQIGVDHISVGVRVTDNEEGDRLWRDVVLAQAPWRAKYQRKSGASSRWPCSSRSTQRFDSSASDTRQDLAMLLTLEAVTGPACDIGART